MKAIGYITVALTSLVLGSIWNGYVLSVLWRWFIVKTFGAPALTVATAIGISIIIRYMTMQRMPETTVEKGKSAAVKMLESIAHAILKPTFALGFGAIVKHWV